MTDPVFLLMILSFMAGCTLGWMLCNVRRDALHNAPANGFTPPYPMPPAARPDWARLVDEAGADDEVHRG